MPLFKMVSDILSNLMALESLKKHKILGASDFNP